jgi:hypothetical protein
MQVALSFPISHETKTVMLPLRQVCIHDVNCQEPGVPRHRDSAESEELRRIDNKREHHSRELHTVAKSV